MSWRNAAEWVRDWAAKVREHARNQGDEARQLAEFKARAYEDLARVMERNDDVTPPAELLKPEG